MVIDPNHDKFEKEVNGWLEQSGFTTFNLTYHEHLPKETKIMLSTMFDPTSLYVRTRADRMALKGNVSFEYEVKTRFEGRGEDLSLEMFPLLVHRLLAEYFSIKCLYICNLYGVEKGFWADDLNIVDQIHVPQKWLNFNGGYFPNLVKRFFKRPYDYAPLRTSGSGDPYVYILKSVYETMSDWRTIVNELDIKENPKTP